MTFEPLNFAAFTNDKARQLKALVRRTQGEISLEDLEQDAWLLALEIGERHQCPLEGY